MEGKTIFLIQKTRSIHYTQSRNETKKKSLSAVCGAKYKTRPGLTYHFTHTHKEPAGGSGGAGASDGDSRDSRPGAHTPPAHQVPPLQPATEYQDSYVTFLNNPAVGTGKYF